jgi:exonuclease VII large subunit
MKGTKLIKSVQDIQPGDIINLQMHDGQADTVVKTTREGAL